METNERTMWKKAMDKQVINGKNLTSRMELRNFTGFCRQPRRRHNGSFGKKLDKKQMTKITNRIVKIINILASQ